MEQNQDNQEMQETQETQETQDTQVTPEIKRAPLTAEQRAKRQKNIKIGSMLAACAVIIILLALLFNPQALGFLGEETQNALQQLVDNNFTALSTNEDVSPVGWSTVVSLFMAFGLLFVIAKLSRFVLGLIKFKNKQRETVKNLLMSVINYLCVIGGIVWGLTILGVNMVAILASLGIMSMIIGFGAQSLIEDILTGVFIVFEGQFSVGDIVSIDGFRGKVLSIGMRTTSIEDVGGNVKIINNSSIKDVHNLSLIGSIAVSDISISYSADIEEAEKVVDKTLKMVCTKYPDIFEVQPKYLGVQSLSESSVDLRIAAEVQEHNIYTARRLLNKELKMAFDRGGIEIPFPQVVVHNGDKPQEK